MFRNTFFISLVVLFALCLLLPYTSRAERAPFIIDGDTKDWVWPGAPGTGFDSDFDVVPVQVDAIDIRGVAYTRDFFLSGNQEQTEGFVFLISTNSESPTPFAGPEERSLEIFFDTVAKAGDPTTVWKETPYEMMGKYLTFAPDRRARVTWKEEKVVELAFEVWDGSAWKTQHIGPSIPEMEAAILGRRMEVAVRWSYITPQRYTEGGEDYTAFAFALRTTQGESHDYYPNPGYEYWFSQYAWDWTAVRAISWGMLKGQMEHSGKEPVSPGRAK